MNRRDILRVGAVATASVAKFVRAGTVLGDDGSDASERAKRVIKIGLVGCGGRGSWISRLFRQHGGYEVYAVADYFQPVANACGEMLGIDRSRCFSGLSGYQRVIESGVEAVILKTPTCFFH